ncbi:MAG: SGNH hydrolase domain-containing protein [Solirubrobacteraceae bacterium]|nr:SGNH hydrolase domain-containing protein [Solirubrobacteraceae bacterium]
MALALLALSAASAAAAPDRDPKPHADGVDAGASPLDMRSVTLGQRGTQLVMRVTTEGEWAPADLSALTQSLCINLYYGRLPTPRSRVCLRDAGEGDAGVAFTRLDPFGGTVAGGNVPAATTRPDTRSVEAIFDPSAVHLGQGRYSWQAVSRWSCDPAAPCADFAPDNGNVIAQIRPLAEPRCFGAASRNPRFRCVNSELRTTVTPAPIDAATDPNAPCVVVSETVPFTCQFGVQTTRAQRTIAVIGDSHAAHWRGAIEVVAQARRWTGYSLTRSGCPLSTATPDLEPTQRKSCAYWRRAVHEWFRRHPEVRTVFVSQLAGLGVRAPRGRSSREYEIQGFLKAWRRLPSTVREIIVLRDTPVRGDETSLCVDRAMRRRQRVGQVCSFPRSRAVRRDPAAIAALRRGMRRVHLVDLTKFMCSPKLCYPVVGGVLVYKDQTHLTPLFASTLGPFLLRSVNRMYGTMRSRGS